MKVEELIGILEKRREDKHIALSYVLEKLDKCFQRERIIKLGEELGNKLNREDVINILRE
jgi:hypothetical protein